jgi:hypothetical protein
MGTLEHEVMHPALQHHTRRNGRDPSRWNMACDYAINPILVDAGLTLPEGVLLEDRFRGMSAERIYNQLEEEEQSQQSSDDQDSQDSDGVLLMVVPQARLASSIPLLAENVADLRVFRLTDPESARFDQVALFGVRKRMRDLD